MANKEHLARLDQGVEAWKQWREKIPGVQPDLSRAYLHGADLHYAELAEANLSGAHLIGADLSHANLYKANLRGAHLSQADLSWAILFQADLDEADLSQANLTWTLLEGANLSRTHLVKAKLVEAKLAEAKLVGANLSMANLSMASLRGADLSGADLLQASLHMADLSAVNLRGADLSQADLSQGNLTAATLVATNFTEANLTGCKVYAISAWNINVTGAQQSNLIITPDDEPVITVDSLEVAQFIYLLLHNEKIRQVIDTITSKAVLILGRFTPERKAVLDAMRDELRRRNYLPIVFDFEKPTSRDLTETISTLAHIARFIIADITEAKSIPQELERIVPNLPSVPVQPILQASANEYGMFEHFKRFPWILETYRYESLEEIIASLIEKVIAPAELKANELLGLMRR